MDYCSNYHFSPPQVDGMTKVNSESCRDRRVLLGFINEHHWFRLGANPDLRYPTFLPNRLCQYCNDFLVLQKSFQMTGYLFVSGEILV
jgi:hypothetical protein